MSHDTRAAARNATVNVDCFQTAVDGGASYTLAFADTCATGGIYVSASVDGIVLLNNTGVGPGASRQFPLTSQVAGTLAVCLVGSGAPCSYTLQITKP